MKESKGKSHKQQDVEERDAAYSQMVQNVERTIDFYFYFYFSFSTQWLFHLPHMVITSDPTPTWVGYSICHPGK